MPVNKGNQMLLCTLLFLVSGLVFSVASFAPVSGVGTIRIVMIDDSFTVTPQENYRQGLGSFHGDENLTIVVNQTQNVPINFTLLTYSGTRYSNTSSSDIQCSFVPEADYYEAAFEAVGEESAEIYIRATVTKPAVEYPLSWLGTPSKGMFLVGWAATLMLILKPIVSKNNSASSEYPRQNAVFEDEKRNLRRLKIAVTVSLIFWFALLVLNSYPLATFENWYTDAARHPYTSVLFTKVGFSVFDTPLGALSSADVSPFKFVTWAEMPHLYPVGSVFLFLPFGAMLEGGVAQVVVFKAEIALFLWVSHVCLYFFLKWFFRQELDVKPQTFLSERFHNPQLEAALKVVATYVLYVVLVVYAANGQFDSVAFLFALSALPFFFKSRFDLFLLLAAAASTFKYQAGIFLLPLIMVSLNRLFQMSSIKAVLRNKVVLAATGLALVDLFTAALSAPFLVSARPELVMNGVNAFSPHAQSSWQPQAFAVMLTLVVTLASAIYLLKRSRLMSLFMVFALVPAFMMPYIQPWYLPFFFMYALIPQDRRSQQVTLVWLIFMAFILAFGGLAYSPLAIAENIRRVLGFW